jgi:acyl carrier protein
LGRRRGDGEIEYLGRIDDQIKLRGVRIELGEIESVIGSHPEVQQAVVAITGEPEKQKLSAYVVAKCRGEFLNAGELRRYLRTKLPERIIPSDFWQIDHVPLLTSGKINRAALKNVGAIQLRDQDNWIGPRNAIEARLATIWSELLKLEQVGVHQNFFELGGHSLLVLQMTARIRRNLNVELPARRVFESPTIAALAEQVEKARALGTGFRNPARHSAAS